jgi:hypothetical protein
MDIAERFEPQETEAMRWADICAEYPDQYVCIVDIDTPDPGSPEIRTARVVGHGPTRRTAFDAIRDVGAKYSAHSVRFTGICTEPLIRPSLVIDDDALEILAEPLILDEKTLDFFRS